MCDFIEAELLLAVEVRLIEPEQKVIADVVDKGTLLLDDQRGDLIGAAEQIEVIHIDGAEIDLQRLVQVGQRDAHGLRLGAVDFEFELRCAGAEASDEGDEARLVLRGGEQLLRSG